MFPFLFMVFAASTAVTEGAGLLPDGPLQKAVGDSVRFNTSNTPTETLILTVTWKFKGENIFVATPANNKTTPGYEDRIIYFPSTASLELRNLLTNDSGEYKVEIISSTGATDEGSTTLEVLEAVSGVTVSPNSADLLENASVTLRCSSSGSSLTFLWMNGSTEVTASDRVQLTDENKTLNFTSVSRYDQGLYRCHVSNPVSHSISETVNITVNYGPEDTRVEVSPNKPYHELGSTIILTCSANSRPSPQFKWHVNSTQLIHDGEKLQLMNVTMSNNGNYSCRAFNPKTSVTVESPPVPITVTETISAISLSSNPAQPVEGTPVNLTCDASGFIDTRKWMKGSSDLTLTDNMTLYDNDKVLSFNVVNKKDTGEYKCNISNPVSSMEAKLLFVVNYGPENVEITGESEVKEGSPIKLSCVAKSVPDAFYSWLLNGTLIYNDSKEFLKNSAGHSDRGEYTCKTWNKITEKTSFAVLRLSVTDQHQPPPPPPPYWIIAVVFVVVIVAVLVGGGYYYYQRKKKLNKKLSDKPVNRNFPTVTGGGAQDNATYSGEARCDVQPSRVWPGDRNHGIPAELNYADIKSFQRKNGERVQLGSQDTTTQYSEVKVNNNPSTSSPPTYDVHMQRINKPTPQPRANVADIYAEVKKNQLN
ncbi:carcinoembryonic antigen-related cell adhesion molecule 1-like isoform X1 [Gouania willdenowi]|uniref:carcinoembryonic antigen-related cell adhesion molecule 1-like isoform X1 n=1 Tax=Gouania willdenowi TaxID=441366 RepID=UPI0010551A27|nr:carcinoembryonic antigen-related cell adhesion molecule 1-like isoform X1 [Gouania willdenowi]